MGYICDCEVACSASENDDMLATKDYWGVSFFIKLKDTHINILALKTNRFDILPPNLNDGMTFSHGF